MTQFVQWAHGLLVDVEDFGKRHSHPLPSFNPHPDELPGAAEATPDPVTMAAPVGEPALTGSPQNTALPILDDAEHTPPGDETVTHTPAGTVEEPVDMQPAEPKDQSFPNDNPHADDKE